MNKLDINKLQKEKQILKIGELKQEIINLLQLNEKPRNIKISYDRIEHCDKHKPDFKDEQSYNKSMELLPYILQNPDYVGYNSNHSSIEYIKEINELTLVAVRLKAKGDLFFRSIYPISKVKLQNGINQNRIKKVKRDTM